MIQVWETPDDWRAWYDGTIQPNLPPGVEATEPAFIDLTLELQPG